MLTFLKDKYHSLFRGNPCESIEVFVRHCYSSSASQHKERFPGFSRQRCTQNLLGTVKEADIKDVHFTFFLDISNATPQEHFLKKQNQFPVIEMHAGSEAVSFYKMLDYVLNKNIDPETMIYFLEDDYIHKPDWVKVLKEGVSLPGIDYVTLFDHKDKYQHSAYPDLKSRIFHTESCHWRTTPSTTNTYAMRFKTLQRDRDIHRRFSMDCSITADHEKFCALSAKGAVLISSLPGWATHDEPKYASPCAHWQDILETTTGHFEL